MGHLDIWEVRHTDRQKGGHVDKQTDTPTADQGCVEMKVSEIFFQNFGNLFFKLILEIRNIGKFRICQFPFRPVSEFFFEPHEKLKIFFSKNLKIGYF